MNKRLIKYGISVLLVLYALLLIGGLLSSLLPSLYQHIASIDQKVNDIIGGWVLLLVVLFVILYLTRIVKVDAKLFWAAVILILLSVIAIMVEAYRQEDT